MVKAYTLTCHYSTSPTHGFCLVTLHLWVFLFSFAIVCRAHPIGTHHLSMLILQPQQVLIACQPLSTMRTTVRTIKTLLEQKTVNKWERVVLIGTIGWVCVSLLNRRTQKTIACSVGSGYGANAATKYLCERPDELVGCLYPLPSSFLWWWPVLRKKNDMHNSRLLVPLFR